MVQIQHPTSAETRMWGKQLAAMLAIYTSRGVAPEVNLRECKVCDPKAGPLRTTFFKELHLIPRRTFVFKILF